MKLGEFLDALSRQQPQAVSTGLSEQRTKELLGDRVPIMLSGALPGHYGLNGLSMTKAPGDSSLCRKVALQASALTSHRALIPLAEWCAQDLIHRVAFVIRDASPDSLLSGLLTLLHLAKVEGADATIAPWLDAVTRWDQGIMPEQPFQSWPALASTLSHARFPMAAPLAGSSVGPRDDHPLKVAWDQSFGFLVESLRTGSDPDRMPLGASGAAARASTAMRRLRQIYDQTLTHATMLQLSVPLANAPGRRVMVDALVYVEDEPSDAVKIFGRVDKARSSGGEGFKLGLSYRPAAAPFNRFTVHAAPSEGLDLTDLWVELERRETAAYRQRDGGSILRPADAAAPHAADFAAGLVGEVDFLPMGRLGPSSFDPADLDQLGARQGRARKLANVNNIWCNPWYLNGDASIIGSPGKDAENADAPPSLLTWEQVIDSLWTVFHPLAGVQVDVRHADGSLVTSALLDAPPMKVECQEGSPALRYLFWRRGTAQATHARGIALSDSNIRVLGALAEQPPGISQIGLPGLPPRAACRQLLLNGGFAVMTERGCVVVDDWADLQLNEVDIKEALSKAVRWRQHLQDHVATLTRFNEEVSTLASDRRQERNSYRLLGDLASARSRLVNHRVAAAAASIADTNARLLYQELRAFWGLADRETHVDDGYDRIERSVRALQDARSAQLLRYLAIFGFPAFIASNVSRPLANFVNEGLISLGLVWRTDTARMRDAWVMMGEAISWVVCTGLLASMLYFIYRRMDPTRR